MTATKLQPSQSGRHASGKLAAQCKYSLFYFLFLIRSYIFCSVNEKQEATRQRAEQTQQCAECPKVKAMKQAIPNSDNENNKDLLERPNAMV